MVDNKDVAYLYSVHPKRIIKTLSDKSIVIRRPQSLFLNLEDVKECLKYGSVYRRFANESRNERVTLRNVERLHNAKFMTEEEYEKLNKKETEEVVEYAPRATVINTIVEPVIEEAAEPEEVQEEVIPAEEEVAEEAVTEDESEINDVTESFEVENSESPESDETQEESDEVVEVEPAVNEEQGNGPERKENRYNNNKQHHNNKKRHH